MCTFWSFILFPSCIIGRQRMFLKLILDSITSIIIIIIIICRTIVLCNMRNTILKLTPGSFLPYSLNSLLLLLLLRYPNCTCHLYVLEMVSLSTIFSHPFSLQLAGSLGISIVPCSYLIWLHFVVEIDQDYESDQSPTDLISC